MTGLMEKIFLTLLLILGLNVFNITHAQDEFSPNEEISSPCPIQGDVSLRLDGSIQNGAVIGWIDNKYVSWFVTMGNIQGYYNNNFMTLRIEEINYHEYSLRGWIGSYYVDWRSFGGYFNERVVCR